MSTIYGIHISFVETVFVSMVKSFCIFIMQYFSLILSRMELSPADMFRSFHPAAQMNDACGMAPKEGLASTSNLIHF